MHTRFTARRIGLIALTGALIAVLSACDPPLEVATTIRYDCQINTHNLLLGTFSDHIDGSYVTTAPQAVAPGSNFTVTVEPQPFTLAASTSGGTVSQLTNVVWRVAIPAGTTLLTATIDDGANLGAATPTTSVVGSNVLITVPGPVLAGAEATFPTLTMSLTATGAAGSRIVPSIAGTSYPTAGLTLDAKVTGTILGTLNPSLACFPSPPKGLHSILISDDVDSPAITIASPVTDQVITKGSVVLAAFTCDDGSGVGVASCVGTVGIGVAIDTATLGSHSFSVTATDLEGKFGTKTVTYSVV